MYVLDKSLPIEDLICDTLHRLSLRAHSSAGECSLDVRNVVGSNPTVPIWKFSSLNQISANGTEYRINLSDIR